MLNFKFRFIQRTCPIWAATLPLTTCPRLPVPFHTKGQSFFNLTHLSILFNLFFDRLTSRSFSSFTTLYIPYRTLNYINFCHSRLRRTCHSFQRSLHFESRPCHFTCQRLRPWVIVPLFGFFDRIIKYSSAATRLDFASIHAPVHIQDFLEESKLPTTRLDLSIASTTFNFQNASFYSSHLDQCRLGSCLSHP